MFPKWGTLFTYGRADVIRIFYWPYCGTLLFTNNGTFWLLNYLTYYSESYGAFYRPLPFLSTAYSFFYPSFFVYFYFVSISFCYFFFFRAILFSNFLNCCLDIPILSPSDKVSGSFFPSSFSSWALITSTSYFFWLIFYSALFSDSIFLKIGLNTYSENFT